MPCTNGFHSEFDCYEAGLPLDDWCLDCKLNPSLEIPIEKDATIFHPFNEAGDPEKPMDIGDLGTTASQAWQTAAGLAAATVLETGVAVFRSCKWLVGRLQ